MTEMPYTFRPADDAAVLVRILPTPGGAPTGKLADAEIEWTAGIFAGLKLLGFSVWERRSGGGRNVTFPARTYSVNGERRTFALLRPGTSEIGHDANNRARDLILQAYAEYEQAQQTPAPAPSVAPVSPALSKRLDAAARQAAQPPDTRQAIQRMQAALDLL